MEILEDLIYSIIVFLSFVFILINVLSIIGEGSIDDDNNNNNE